MSSKRKVENSKLGIVQGGVKLKVYLDMCVYNRPFDDQSDLRVKLETVACQIIFDRLQKGEVYLVWSFMLEFENELNPFTERKNEIVLLSRLAGHIVEPHRDIMTKAEEVEKGGIKGHDAVHLACGLFSNCHYSTGAIVNGGATMGRGSFVGSNSVSPECASTPCNSFIKANILFGRKI